MADTPQDTVDDTTTDTTTTTDDTTTTTTTDTRPDDTHDDDTAGLRAEVQRLRREAAAREKERRKAEADARRAEETRKAEQGQYKELAEERAQEIEQLKQQLADRDRQDAERDQRSRVEQVAERLNFRRPKRAYVLLLDELGAEDAADTLADEQLTEAALKRLAKAEPELVDQARRSGAPVNGGRTGVQQTPEQEMGEFLLGIIPGAQRQ